MRISDLILKMIEPIKTKIYLIIGRAILTAVNNSEKNQKVQVTGLSGEIISDMERVQNYGFETYPVIDGNDEVVSIFLNGNREKGIGIIIGNREYRPKDLQSGEVKIYCKSGEKESFNFIKLSPTNNTIQVLTKDGNEILCDSNGIKLTDANSNTVEMKTGQIDITSSGIVNVNGSAKSFVTYAELNTALNLFMGFLNAHTHPTATPGIPSPPTNPMVLDISASESTKAKTG